MPRSHRPRAPAQLSESVRKQLAADPRFQMSMLAGALDKSRPAHENLHALGLMAQILGLESTIDPTDSTDCRLCVTEKKQSLDDAAADAHALRSAARALLSKLADPNVGNPHYEVAALRSAVGDAS